MATLSQLSQDSTALTTAVANAVTALNSLAAQVKALSNDQAVIDSVDATVTKATADLVAATPAPAA